MMCRPSSAGALLLNVVVLSYFLFLILPLVYYFSALGIGRVTNNLMKKLLAFLVFHVEQSTPPLGPSHLVALPRQAPTCSMRCTEAVSSIMLLLPSSSLPCSFIKGHRSHEKVELMQHGRIHPIGQVASDCTYRFQCESIKHQLVHLYS